MVIIACANSIGLPECIFGLIVGIVSIATQSPCAVAAAARAGRERPARLIGLDLACALLAFSRPRAGGGSI